MKRTILFAFVVISLLVLFGCAEKEESSVCYKPYFEYMKGQCCLDSNNDKICDKDETKEEKTVEEKGEKPIKIEEDKKEYNVDFEVSGLLVYYTHEYKKDEFGLKDISYKITNKQDDLNDLKMKIEIYKGDQKIVESSMISLFEEKIIKKGETVLDRNFVNLQAYPYRGVGNIPNIFVTVKIYLYQGNILLKEDTWDYKLEVNSQRIYLTDKHSAYSLDYKNIPVRFSKDSKIESIITRTSEDFIDLKIKNIASEPIERQLILDYYCENLVDGTSFLINDYYSYLDDLFMFKISDERYTGTPPIILPNEEIRLQIPKLNCGTHILILRKESEYYVTPY